MRTSVNIELKLTIENLKNTFTIEAMGSLKKALLSSTPMCPYLCGENFIALIKKGIAL